MDPGHRPVVVGEFHTMAFRGPAGRGLADVAVEHEFGGLVEKEQADRDAFVAGASFRKRLLHAARAKSLIALVIITAGDINRWRPKSIQRLVNPSSALENLMSA
jgi:hypothetical protein